MEPVVKVDNLKKYYEVSKGFMKGSATLKALDGVSFGLKAGQTIAVVGESGCGKSTLAKQIMHIETPTSGRILIDNMDVAKLSKTNLKKFRQKIQLVFQNPYGSLNPRKKVGQIIEEPLIINTKLSKEERKKEAEEALVKVGLRKSHYRRYPHMFSGGQRQRIAIARALMLHPKVIIADEPVSALDVSIQAQILNLMMDLQDEMKLAYLFISHDLSVVHHIADEVIVMYLGKVVEHATKNDLYKGALHPYTKALLASTPHTDPSQRSQRMLISGELPSPLNPPTGCSFHTRCPHATNRCKMEEPKLREIDKRHVACHHAEKISGIKQSKK